MPQYTRGLYSDSTAILIAAGSAAAATSSLYVSPILTPTAATLYFTYLAPPTVSGGAATNAYTLYIAGAPTNTTNAYSFYINSGMAKIADTTATSSSTTGALVVSGGVGIGGDVRVAGTVYGTISGTISTSSVQVTSNGTVGAPAYSWTNSTNSGFYLVAAGNIGLTLAGTEYINYATTAISFITAINANGPGNTTSNLATIYIAPASTTGSASTFYFTYLTAPTISGTTATTAYTAYIAGAPTNTTTAYALYVAAGLTALLGGLTLTGATSISSITGAAAIDFSGGSGAFKTSTGAITLGGNTSTITIGSGATPSTNIVVSAGTTGNIDFSNSSGAFKTSTGAITLGGNTSTITIGSGATPSTNIVVSAGTTGNIDFSNSSGAFKTSTGAITLGGNTSTITIGSGATPSTNIVVSAGTTGNIDFSNSSGAFKTTTGAITIGSGTVGITGIATFNAQLTATQVGNTTLTSAPVYIAPASTTGSASTFYFTYFTAPTISGTTATAAYTVYIAGAPTNTTTAYALYINSGNMILAGASSSLLLSNTTVSTSSSTGALQCLGGIFAKNLYLGGVSYSNIAGTLTGPLFNIVASTITTTSNADMAFTSFAQPTLAATGTQTTTNAYTVYIANAPVAGTNETITNKYALGIATGNVIFNGTNLYNTTYRPASGSQINMYPFTDSTTGTFTLLMSPDSAGWASGGTVQLNFGDTNHYIQVIDLSSPSMTIFDSISITMTAPYVSFTNTTIYNTYTAYTSPGTGSITTGGIFMGLGSLFGAALGPSVQNGSTGGIASGSANYISLYDNPIFMRGTAGSDKNHYLMYGNAIFATIDGPALVGFAGGQLAYSNSGGVGGSTWALKWLAIDNTFTGSPPTVTTNVLFYAAGSSNQTISGAYGYLATTGAGTNSGSGSQPFSIYSAHRIQSAGEIDVSSSIKIKNKLLEDTAAIAEAVNKFAQIQFCKYQYKDKISNGNAEIYGMIAEELHAVHPNYVNTEATGIIPNIYLKAKFLLTELILELNLDIIDLQTRNINLESLTNKQLKIMYNYQNQEITKIFNEFKFDQNKIIIKLEKKLEIDEDAVFVYGTNETCPTITKNNVFEMGMCVIKHLLNENEQLKSKINELAVSSMTLENRLFRIESALNLQ